MIIKQKEFELLPDGIYNGVCVDVIDLGMETANFNGDIKCQPKVRVVFELPEDKRTDGAAFTISLKATASVHEKSKLRPVYEALTKKKANSAGTDLDEMKGQCGMICVEHKALPDGKTIALITKVMRAKKKVEPTGKYDPAAARKRIEEAKAKAAPAPASQAGAKKEEDDVPF